MFSIQQFAASSQLPTLPEVALKLVEIAHQDDPDYREVSRIIRSDPVVAGKVLKTVNSALFGLRHKVETVEQAVPKLGITLLRTLILSFHLARHKTRQQELEPVFQKLWRSSLTQAVIAELIAEQVAGTDPPTCFLAAMLQDIGILAMISEAPVEYLDNVLDRAAFPSVVSAERACFGFSHAEVSAQIVDQWGMGSSFGGAIERHHDQIVSPHSNRNDRLKIVLQAANLGAAVLGSSRSSERSLNCLLDQWIGFLIVHFGFSESHAEEIISEVNRRVADYSILFSFNIGEGIQADEVVVQAKNMLQEIALKNQVELMSSKSVSGKRRTEKDELYRDSLSGLFNRRYMNEHLDARVAGCIKREKSIACLFMDVDKFKSINDNCGHAAGDKAIQHVANWLTESIRRDDIAIRLGGDEFLVVLQMVSETEFERIAHRIANDIPPLKLPDETLLDVSLSVGCTFYQPVAGDDLDANWLVDRADESMYRAKKRGGDRVSVRKYVGSQVKPLHCGQGFDVEVCVENHQ